MIDFKEKCLICNGDMILSERIRNDNYVYWCLDFPLKDIGRGGKVFNTPGHYKVLFYFNDPNPDQAERIAYINDYCIAVNDVYYDKVSIVDSKADTRMFYDGDLNLFKSLMSLESIQNFLLLQ